MSVIRAFIAIELSHEIHKRLEEVMSQLKGKLEKVPIRWVPAENIHLTLKFLGDVSVSNLDMLKAILQTEASGHHGFEISVGGVGAFPNNRQPHVIWVGVEAPAELGAIQRGIEAAMARIGYAREERPFSPHLTLGRVSRNATSRESHLIGEVIESTRIGFLGVDQARTIHLYRSDLKPTGAVYTRIFTANLAP